MDSKIRKYPSIDIGDGINWCYNHEIGYQSDLSHCVEYSEDYFQNYLKYEKSPIADDLNDFRVNFAKKYVKNGILDIGIGCGTFLNRLDGIKFGYDINPRGVSWLRERGLYLDPYQEALPEEIEGVTFWDVLEHIPNPDAILELIRKDMYVILSIPIFIDIKKIKSSKHYKPGEHLTYWTDSGLKRYFSDMGYKNIEQSSMESLLGRDSICSYIFKKIV